MLLSEVLRNDGSPLDAPPRLHVLKAPHRVLLLFKEDASKSLLIRWPLFISNVAEILYLFVADISCRSALLLLPDIPQSDGMFSG